MEAIEVVKDVPDVSQKSLYGLRDKNLLLPESETIRGGNNLGWLYEDRAHTHKTLMVDIVTRCPGHCHNGS